MFSMALTTGLPPPLPQKAEEQDGPLSVCTDDMDSSLAPFRMYPSPPAIQIVHLYSTPLQDMLTQVQEAAITPSELLQLIVAYLDTRTLKDVALVSHTLNQHATDKLWQNVCLADQWKLHLNEKTDQVWGDRGHGESDEHDDTPIIQKLYILATNPNIASKVHVVTHRCHLPTPNIFNELPRMSFDAENLSQDARIHVLVKLALRNLVNVHTLRIVYGHWKLTNTLVAGFLDESRPRRVPCGNYGWRAVASIRAHCTGSCRARQPGLKAFGCVGSGMHPLISYHGNASISWSSS
ncbi:hypothetical protein P3342_011570 [Pyrenophora teres f. teres]|nr:hypothetical protein P3342_011570 [Pyrenophora teres f. teres]